MASSNDSVSRLALSCSALARCGQILSGVSSPAGARAALAEAADLLDQDVRKSGWPQIEKAAAECRSVAASAADADLVASCRRLATNLARQASTLATEVQQHSKKAASAKPGAPTAVPPPQKPSIPAAKPVVPAAQPTPKAKPASPRKAETAPAPRPVAQPSEPPRKARAADIERVRIAVSAHEKEAVAAALESGDRFALVGSDVVIDVKQNLMWMPRLGPVGSYSAALEFAAGWGGGGYNDWRLPRPDEVQQLLQGGGRAWAVSHGIIGGAASMVWTSDARWRWLRFRKEVTAVDLQSGAIETRSAREISMAVLVVR
jgi:hypothetical protein